MGEEVGLNRRQWFATAGAAAVSAGRNVARAQVGPLGQAVHSCRIYTEADTDGSRKLLRVEDGWAAAHFVGEAVDPHAANVWLWDRDGGLRWSAAVYPKGALRMVIWDVATRRKGDAVVVASGVDSAGRMAHFLCVVGADGVPGAFLQTNPYSPRHVTFGPDDSIWTFGRNIDAENEKSDHDLFAKYDGRGEGLEKTFFPRSAFSAPIHPSTHGRAGTTCLRSAADRIGAYVSQSEEWLEFGAEGDLLGRWPAKTETGGIVDYLALTASAELYSWQRGKGTVGLYRFDRAGARWRSLPETVSERSQPAVGPLLGADGDRLVHYAGWPERNSIEWHDAPPATGA